jgi:hypothetical protein
MTLVDASAYNIQFLQGRPILIDTLSLRQAVLGEPWTAYRQYCQHFLAPLALMSFRDIRLGQLLRAHIDGIPLDLASLLLPFRSCRRPSLLLHLHLHARSQKRYEGREVRAARGRVGRQALLGLRGGTLDGASVEKALALSEERFCPVWAMVKAAAPIKATYRLLAG